MSSENISFRQDGITREDYNGSGDLPAETCVSPRELRKGQRTHEREHKEVLSPQVGSDKQGL
jgi:hypothetical protein